MDHRAGRAPDVPVLTVDGDDLLALGLTEAAAAMRDGTLDARELTEQYLAQIERTEPTLNAYVTVDARGARTAAARAAREMADGHHRGPLHGIPLGVKDLIDTADLTTTYGSALFRGHVPSRDARVVTELRRSGAVILGKHATHEFAWGGRTDGSAYGATRNPHDSDRIPGGSSGGGGASVVARSALAAVGTDTAGSVRIPAALSGCVGLKPTNGWMSLTGVHPLAPSLDVVGLLTRSSRDARLLHRALGGARTGAPPAVRTVGFLDDGTEELDPEVSRGLAWARQRLEDEGFEVEPVALPSLRERALAVLTWVRAEAEEVHRAAFATSADGYGADLAALLALGPVSEGELRAARRVVQQSVTAVRAALSRHTALASATVPVTAPLIGQLEVDLGGGPTPVELVLTRLTSVANAAGLPAVSVPVPTRGLPVGVQLIGPPEGEERLFLLADVLERDLDAPAEEARGFASSPRAT